MLYPCGSHDTGGRNEPPKSAFVAGEAVFLRNDDSVHSHESGEGAGSGENEQEVRVKADIIVGADGAGSRTRSLVQKAVRTLSFPLLQCHPELQWTSGPVVSTHFNCHVGTVECSTTDAIQ